MNRVSRWRSIDAEPFAAEPVPPLERIAIRRMCMYVEKAVRMCFREKLFGYKSLDWLDRGIKSFLEEAKTRYRIAEYKVVVKEDSAVIEIQPQINSPWITISTCLNPGE